MLTKEDLRWTTRFLSLYSEFGVIPVTFKPSKGILGEGAGEMKTGQISIWKRAGFKLTQILLTLHALFISCRTFEYASGGGSVGDGGEEEEDKEGQVLDWDLVPITHSH